MLVGPDGQAVGSVSGGCVEGAVYELGSGILEGTDPATLQRYGVSDDDAFAVGLTCGGILDVFVEQVDPENYPELGEIAKAVREHRPVAVATVVSGPADVLGRRLVVWPDHTDGSLGTDRLDHTVRDDARGLLAAGRSTLVSYGTEGQRRGEGLGVFVESFAPPPRLIVFGAIDFAAAVARIGTFLGMRVTVCDARPVFATSSRFPEAHEVVVEWPHRYLEAEAEAGVTEAELARMSSPIGLDLGARTPEETAVSIAAEMIARQWGGDGTPLSARQGPIHADANVEPGVRAEDLATNAG
jgi:xanthine dehydrogenase accessory factor